MVLLQNLKERSKKLKCELTAVYYAYNNPRVGVLPKILISLALGYALSPIDLIPDFIPVLGLIDDLVIVPVLISLSIKLIPPAVMQECRQKAENEPLSLKKNWIAAAVFVIIWMLLFYLFVNYLIFLRLI